MNKGSVQVLLVLDVRQADLQGSGHRGGSVVRDGALSYDTTYYRGVCHGNRHNVEQRPTGHSQGLEA
jgi:hypothetical protein